MRPGEITQAEAAAILGVHVNTVGNWIRSGTLPSTVAPGYRNRRVLRADVLDLARRRVGSRTLCTAPEPHLPLATYRLAIRGGVTAVRERVERKLGVETTVEPTPDGWAVYFLAHADVDLDFLRPDVLPPKKVAA